MIVAQRTGNCGRWCLCVVLFNETCLSNTHGLPSVHLLDMKVVQNVFFGWLIVREY